MPSDEERQRQVEGREHRGATGAYKKRQDSEGGRRAAARDEYISKIISKARDKADVSQERCAAYLGVSRPYYAKFELGETTLSVGQVEALLDMLDVKRSEVWAASRGEAPTWYFAVAPGESVQLIVEGDQKTQEQRWKRQRKKPPEQERR